MRRLWLLLFACVISCHKEQLPVTASNHQYLVVLGIAQDGGYPHIGCTQSCCKAYYDGSSGRQKVASLGLIDKVHQQKFLFEATPDITEQWAELNRHLPTPSGMLNGIFLTHAHIGHYTGLQFLGREALGKMDVPVFAMPKMQSFLQNNGPWSQLIALNNLKLRELRADSVTTLNSHLQITPILVPHRDEFSETVGYHIQGKNKSALFIPDINKWSLWEKDIVAEVKKVDYAFLDATFLKDGEIPRPMSEVPHPFIAETVELFKNESKALRNKVIFIHFNHSNPALQPNSKARKELESVGFRFATEGHRYGLE